MANIDKTVKSKYPPKQKNVNWIDTSGDKPEMKTFFNGKWTKTGGGGSGGSGSLPPMTSNDIGKVLTVGEEQTSEIQAVWSNPNNNGLIIPSFTYESLSGYESSTQWYAKINKLDLSSEQAPETNVFLIPIDLLSSGGDKRYAICVIDKVYSWPDDGNDIGAVIGFDARYYHSGGTCKVYYKQGDNEYVYLNVYMEGDGD